MKSTAVRTLIVIAIAVAALLTAFWGVEIKPLLGALAEVDVGRLLLGLATIVAAHFARAVRWGRIVQAVEPAVPMRSTTSIHCIGMLVVQVLPFRIGELARPLLLRDQDEVPFGAGLATVALERFLDVAALGLMFAGLLLFVDLPMREVSVAGQNYDVVSIGRKALFATGVPVAAVLVVLLGAGEHGVRITRKAGGVISPRVGELAGSVLSSFGDGMRAISRGKRAVSVLAWTALSWVISIWGTALIATAFVFGAGMGFWEGAVVLALVCFATMLPAPPGFIGVYELAVTIAVVLLGAPQVEAAAYAITLHAASLVVILGSGLVFLALDRVGLRGLVRSVGEGHAPPPGYDAPPSEDG